MQSGVNNPEAENQEGVELQDEEVMKALYNTKGFLRRNVLQVRQKRQHQRTQMSLLDQQPQLVNAQICLQRHSQRRAQRKPSQQQPSLQQFVPRKHPTKKDTLHQAGEDLASMLSVVTTIKEKQSSEGASK
ncbi:unnamed protein product [Calypogeia fissa]